MVRYVSGDILNCDASILLNIVDCHGSLNDSLIRAYAQRFPSAYRIYRSHCAQYGHKLFGSHINIECYKQRNRRKFLAFIFNREVDKVEFNKIEKPLEDIFKFAKSHKLTVAVPGNFGFLKPSALYNKLRCKIESLARELDVNLMVYI